MTQLNRKQRRAVQLLDRPLLVIAGAGSGKTRVITEKIVHLLEKGLDPGGIYAITFTNKAAREMGERLERRLAPQGRRPWISTFHTLGLEILRREHRALGLRRNFSVLDEGDRLELLRNLLKERGGDEGKLAEWSDQISRYKNRRQSPDPSDELFPLFQDYERSLRAYQAVDFDDLILLPLLLLERHAEIRERWRRKIAYLLVDEWQDTDLAQYLLFKQLVGPEGRFTVVGDDDQAIYGFRGADPENLKRLVEDFPNLEVVTLDQNYRSTRTILEAANAVIRNNPHLFPKRLWSRRGEGEKLQLLRWEEEEGEAMGIALDLLSRKERGEFSWSEVAILYRGNHQARRLERALRELAIPYTVYGGLSFFAHREVKDLIAYLRLLANPDDDIAFLRAVGVPKREIGTVTLKRLAGYAGRRGISLFTACFELGLLTVLPRGAVDRLRRFCEWLVDVADRARRGDPKAVIASMVEEIGYFQYLEQESRSQRELERRRERVRDLLRWIDRLIEEAVEPPAAQDPVAYAVQRLQLYDLLDQREGRERREAVSLMTVHASKGLEFEAVYLVGLTDGLFPHQSGHLEEERRLFYVAMTRARSLLILSHPQKGRHGDPLTPSRFLSEIPSDLIEDGVDPASRKRRAETALSAMWALFEER